MLSCFSCVRLFAILWAIAHQAPLSMEFSRQEYWTVVCRDPPLGNLPDPEIEPASPVFLSLQAVLYPLSHVGSLTIMNIATINTGLPLWLSG